MNTKYKLEDYIGKKFGKWTILEDIGYINNCYYVKCKCECGLEKNVSWQHLKRGLSTCCIHCGHKHYSYSKERLYRVWRGMLNRCYCKNVQKYEYYGAKGIKVCDEWKNNYLIFRKWAYTTGYDDKAAYGKCTLDRIDVNGNYCPENCRWVDLNIQNKNKNVQKNSISGYTGIYFKQKCQNKLWESTIFINDKLKHIGYYTTKKEAVEARNKYIIDNNLIEYKIQEWKDE